MSKENDEKKVIQHKLAHELADRMVAQMVEMCRVHPDVICGTLLQGADMTAHAIRASIMKHFPKSRGDVELFAAMTIEALSCAPEVSAHIDRHAAELFKYSNSLRDDKEPAEPPPKIHTEDKDAMDRVNMPWGRA